MTKRKLRATGLKKPEWEIEKCIEIYVKEGSVERTAKAIGWSKNTVNKYVKAYSCKNNNIARSKAIYQIDTEGNKKYYKSIFEACKVNGFKVSNISKCLNKTTKTAYGFVWCFTENIEEGKR